MAKDTSNAFGRLRMMVLDLKRRRVAATGSVQKTLLNWTPRARLGRYFVFQRFEKNALFDGATGHLVAAVHCPKETWGVVRAAHGRVWLCGTDKKQGRLSLRELATFRAVPGRFNFAGTTDVRTEPDQYFELTYAK